MTPLYLYCIIRCSQGLNYDEAAPIGGGAGPVYAIPHNGLAAVVSPSPTTRYESTRENLLAHQRVQERAMRDYSLLPVRFGTVADSTSPVQGIQKLLEKRWVEFGRLLEEVEGKIELGLKALWRDERPIFEEIVDENGGIRRLRDSLQGRSAQATHFDRMRLGEMVKAALERKRSAEAENLLAPLRRIACRTVENPIFVDRMIVNAAFLVDKGREKQFDETVGRLDSELGRRVALKYVGPVPPYNFVNIVVNWEQILEQ